MMATKTWVGAFGLGGDDWNTAANWDPAVVPIAGDDIEIMNTGTVFVNSIASFDNSLIDLGNVVIGPNFQGNIGDDGPNYLILSFGAGKRLTINGAPLLTTQAMFIDIDTTNTTDVFCESYGPVTTATMDTLGIHLKDTSGPGVDTFYRNSGCPLTLDTGVFESLIDDGTARSVVNATNVNAYESNGSGVVSSLATIPSSLMTVNDGIINVTSSAVILNNLVMDGGTVNWTGGSSINTLAKINAGTFDTSAATKQMTITAMEISGDAATTLVDLTFAIVSGNIRNNATGAVLIPPIGSDLTIT